MSNLRRKRVPSIDRQRDDPAFRLADDETVNEAAVLRAQGDTDHIAKVPLAGLGVEVADGGQGFPLDDGGGVRPGGVAAIGGRRGAGAGCLTQGGQQGDGETAGDVQ
jgi:hypothetical protein